MRAENSEEAEALFALVFMLALLCCVAAGFLACPAPAPATPTPASSPRPTPSPSPSSRPAATPAPGKSAITAPAATPTPCGWPQFHNTQGDLIVLPASMWSVFEIDVLPSGLTEIQVFDRDGRIHPVFVREPVAEVVRQLKMEPCF